MHQYYPLWIYAANGSLAGVPQAPSYEQSALIDTVEEFALLSTGDKSGISDVFYDDSINCADITGCPCRRKLTGPHINNCPLAGDETDDIPARDVVQSRYSEEMDVAYPYNSSQSCQSHTSSGSEYRQDLTVLNVMIVQRNHETETNVARRCGVGKVFLKKWTETSPQFKTVVLE